MTREEVKEMLPVLQAFADGKTIESRCIKGDKSLWYDDEDPIFDNDLEYRIKPEPNYRPFKNAEECWAEMQKHQPFGWIKVGDDEYFYVVSLSQTYIGLVTSSGNIVSLSYRDAYYDYNFVDGTPFCVKVDE